MPLYGFNKEDTVRIRKLLDQFEAGRLSNQREPRHRKEAHRPVETRICRADESVSAAYTEDGKLYTPGGTVSLFESVAPSSGQNRRLEDIGLNEEAYNIHHTPIISGEYYEIVREPQSGKWFFVHSDRLIRFRLQEEMDLDGSALAKAVLWDGTNCVEVGDNFMVFAGCVTGVWGPAGDGFDGWCQWMPDRAAYEVVFMQRVALFVCYTLYGDVASSGPAAGQGLATVNYYWRGEAPANQVIVQFCDNDTCPKAGMSGVAAYDEKLNLYINIELSSQFQVCDSTAVCAETPYCTPWRNTNRMILGKGLDLTYDAENCAACVEPTQKQITVVSDICMRGCCLFVTRKTLNLYSTYDEAGCDTELINLCANCPTCSGVTSCAFSTCGSSGCGSGTGSSSGTGGGSGSGEGPGATCNGCEIPGTVHVNLSAEEGGDCECFGAPQSFDAIYDPAIEKWVYEDICFLEPTEQLWRFEFYCNTETGNMRAVVYCNTHLAADEVAPGDCETWNFDLDGMGLGPCCPGQMTFNFTATVFI